MVISIILSLLENEIADLVDGIFFITFLIFFIALCFKKNLTFLQKLKNSYKKSAVYLSALGCVEYFSLIFGFVPASIYGYKEAQAQYEGIEYSSWMPQYLTYMTSAILWLTLIALVFATYLNFFKTRGGRK